MAIHYGHHEAPRALGSLLQKSGDVDGAIAVYRQAASDGDADAALELGYMLHGEGRGDEAIAAYRRCAELGDLGVNGNLGLLLQELNRHDEAVAAWREAADAGYPGAAYYLGCHLKAQGDLKGANQRFTTAKEGFRREMELSNRDAYYFYAQTCLEEEDQPGALSALLEAARLGHQDAPRLLRSIAGGQLAPPS
jgi:tetratricopeptide (TPR) repeat protein